MSKSDRILPPGPNPREDQMTEKDQQQLRQAQREKGSGKPSSKVQGPPDQAEGSRETVEHELRANREKD